MNQEPNHKQESSEIRHIAESDTNVPQVYTDFVSELAKYGPSDKSHDNEVKQVIEDLGKENSEITDEPLDDFVITNYSSVERASKKIENEENVIKDECGTAIRIKELLHSLVNIIEEYDSYLQRVQDSEVRQLIELLQHRLIECLTANGVETIKNKTVFNCLEHVAIPFSVVPDGTHIKEVIRDGLVFEGMVLLKSQVPF